MKTKFALVLGSSGLIGKTLTRFLMANNFCVTQYDIQIDREENDLSAPKNSISIKTLDYEVSVADVVFFLAFDVGGSKYLEKYENTLEFISKNVHIMDNVFESIKRHNKKVIFISSMMTKIPVSTYGILKTLGERYCTTVNGISVRFWNVYGIEHESIYDLIDNSEKNHVITDFIVSGISKKKIETLTTGAEVRQFIHVNDAAESLISIYENFDRVKADIKIKNDYAIDVSSGTWVKIADIANLISNSLNVPVMFGTNLDKVQKDSKIEPDLEIIHGLFWKQNIDLETGINSIIAHYKRLLGKLYG